MKSVYAIFIMFIAVGMLIAVPQAVFYVGMINGDYEEIQATVVDYEKSKSGSGRRKTTTYRKVYEYEEDGKTKRFTSSVGSNVGLGNIGDKATLYYNKKTGKVRDEPSKIMIAFGVLFSVVGIIGMYKATHGGMRPGISVHID